MKAFTYVRALNPEIAIHEATTRANAKFIGGGTNLVDLMRENIEQPDLIVDINGLDLTSIEILADGGLRLGALAKNSAVADHRVVRERYPVLAHAFLSGASPQLRNMATVGGNLMQRTRCTYFYDQACACNKRDPGSGCDAIDGFNRLHAILGASESCIATNPSDMCVALVALDAVIKVQGRNGERSIPIEEFHRLPDNTPQLETNLASDELIIAIELPASSALYRNSLYIKRRDRASYAFALVSVAGALEIKDGTIQDVRLALGGIAHKPWRAHKAEDALRGQKATEEVFRRAADLELQQARPHAYNAFKIELAKRTIVTTLRDLTQSNVEVTA